MIDRLEKSLKENYSPPIPTNSFYTRQKSEAGRYRSVGVPDGVSPDDDGATWNTTHTATLEDYKLK